MTQIYGGPGKYIQGYDELLNIKEHVSYMGRTFLLLASRNRMNDLGKVIESSLGEDFNVVELVHEGESSWKNVEKTADVGRANKVDAVIGMGGGKVIDTAKTAADKIGVPIIVIPTIAATDAATGSLAVIYNEDGSLEQEVHFPKNPEIVLVDTHVIMNAPARFLVAGMGDALSTYIGARVAYQQYCDNEFGGKPTEASMALSRLSYDLLLKHGVAAKLACEQKVMTKDLNKIIEVNTLLSGLGMESSGGATDHTFYYAFCSLTHREEHMYHGEFVAFSTIASLVLQGADSEEIDEVVRFCQSVGLPTTLKEMMLDDLTETEYDMIAADVLAQGGPKNHPFEVTAQDAIAAVKTTDAIGRLYMEGKSLLL